jgi:hypothetical protein
MSWLIKQYKNGKFGIWTTISDGWVTMPKSITREQAVAFIAKRWREDTERKIKELKETFPKGWYDYDTNKFIF